MPVYGFWLKHKNLAGKIGILPVKHARLRVGAAPVLSFFGASLFQEKE